ncbi:MAG: N-6 DNA methylase [Asgard group archaeon]|nr:N-6 DNA methylase [Asgard group archaeon]
MSRNVNAKKLSGEFFTPSTVVDFMVGRIFNHLEAKGRILDNSFTEFQDTFLKIKFCDPAVGTGNFILGLLRFVWKKIQRYENLSFKEQNNFLKSFVQENVYGVEIKKSSLDLGKSRIVNQYPQLEIKDLKNLRTGNSLVDLDAYEVLRGHKIEKLIPFSWTNSFSKDIKFDVIIGNPPYFNLKKMILKDESVRLLYQYLKNSTIWSKYFRASSDIYYYFIIRSLEYLNLNGFLSFILPNYWIENKYADKLREILIEYQILDIYDFGDLNVFKDDGKWLNISTCVFTLEKTSPYEKIQITKEIPRNFFRNERVKTLCFSVDSSDLTQEKWILSPYVQKIKKIEIDTNYAQLSSIAAVAQGMSPGVKSVFVLDKKTTELLHIESDVLVPFVTNKHIKKWKLDFNEKLFAILPSLIQNLEDYPNTMKYLQENRENLEAGPDRKRLLDKGKIRWYDFSVYRNLNFFTNMKSKILCPYRSLTPKFSLDNEGHFGATDIYAISPYDSNDIFNLLGILNSSFMEFWFREAGKRKGKMLEFFSDPLRRTPVPHKNKRDFITSDVRNIIQILDKNSNTQTEEIREIEDRINEKVARMYNFDYAVLQKYLQEKK